jgi:hypothetical protein
MQHPVAEGTISGDFVETKERDEHIRVELGS